MKSFNSTLLGFLTPFIIMMAGFASAAYKEKKNIFLCW